MATSTQHTPVTVEAALEGPPSEYGMEELLNGLHGVMCEMGDPLAHLHDKHPARDAFYEYQERLAADVAPRVVAMLAAEMRSRLPWTWAEGEER